MFRRKAYDRLLAWKGADDRTAMLIEGARRVGKSTVAEEFAKNEYESYALIDFTRVDAEFKQTFLDLRNDLDGLFLYLSAALGVTLTQHQSLVIFDEVQMSSAPPRGSSSNFWSPMDGSTTSRPVR